VPEQYYFSEEKKEIRLSADFAQPRRSTTKRSVSQTERSPAKANSVSVTSGKDPNRSVRVWRKHRILSALSKARQSDQFTEHQRSKASGHRSFDESDREKTEDRWGERIERVKRREKEAVGELVRKANQSQQALAHRLQRLQSSKLALMRQRGESNRSRMAHVHSHLVKLAAQDEDMLQKMREKQLDKMEKSQKDHLAVLKSRSLSAARKRKQAGDGLEENESLDRLLDFLRKQQALSQRLGQTRASQDQVRAAHKQAEMQRWQRFERNRKEKLSEAAEQAKAIEQKNHTESVSKSCMKDSFYRREVTNSQNLEKLKRIHSAKQAQILSRNVQASRRYESLKRSRRQQQEKCTEALHSSLLERDRTYELVELIGRSPNCRKVKEALKEWTPEEVVHTSP